MDEPEAPSGYSEPYRFRYPSTVLLLGSFALGLLAAGGYGWVLWQFHGEDPFEHAFSNGTTEMIAPFLVAVVATVVVHELIHGALSMCFGYDVQYGAVLSKGVFYTATFGQYQSREHLFPILLAPLLVITLVTLPVLFVTDPLVAIVAYLVLILNTAGSVGDLYAVGRLLHLPRGTLLYDLDTDRMYVFEPRATD